jgi:hypothetical protein
MESEQWCAISSGTARTNLADTGVERHQQNKKTQRQADRSDEVKKDVDELNCCLKEA